MDCSSTAGQGHAATKKPTEKEQIVCGGVLNGSSSTQWVRPKNRQSFAIRSIEGSNSVRGNNGQR